MQLTDFFSHDLRCALHGALNKATDENRLRMELAAQILPGVIVHYKEADQETHAKFAVQYADMIIKEVNKNKK